MPVTVHVDRSRYAEIISAIEVIATRYAGLDFGYDPARPELLRSATYEMPEYTDIDAAGYPYFVVRFGEGVGWGQGGDIRGGDLNMRGIGHSEPAWDFSIYAFYPNEHESFPLAAHALVSLLQAFMINDSLDLTTESDPEGVDNELRIVDPKLTYSQFKAGRLLAAKLTIRVVEYLNTTYSPDQ